MQCGVDALAGDPCATSNWCLGGAEGSLGWYLEKVIKEWPGKKLILGGGNVDLACVGCRQSVHFSFRRLQFSQRCESLGVPHITGCASFSPRLRITFLYLLHSWTILWT